MSDKERAAAPPTDGTEGLGTKLLLLREAVRRCGSALVAFSGGVDSTLVLRVAVEELGDRAVALTAVSETMARREVEEARELARLLGARHEVVRSHELDRPGFADNPVDRCYHCKIELLDLCEPVARRLGLARVLLGTNLDDLGDYRPGLVAARQRGAGQPLVEAGLTKAEVRALSRQLGLPTWDKPQMACLSSRFPYGTRITPERLEMVDRFEEALRELGFRQLRVRLHALPDLAGAPGSGGALARIEVPEEDLERALSMRRDIVAAGRRCGFLYVSLDLAGFRSGSANLVLLGGRPAGDTMPAEPRPRKLVVAALVQGEDGSVLLSQRRADQTMPLLWELPGGKVEPGETPQQALARELREELDVEATVGEVVDVVSHRYDDFELLMLVYRCTLSGPPRARQVAQVRFVSLDSLSDYPILPADGPLIEKLRGMR